MSTSNKINCPECGTPMIHHADKIDYDAGDDAVFGGVVKEVHSCPHCGHIELIEASRII
jgi:predicted RNA-binding Zn-ribbon protein involved in translation (DUF1610 family)